MSQSSVNVRVVLQQCLSARLQVQPATDDNEAEFVEIGRGLVIYVCFMNGAQEDKDLIGKLVKAVMNVKLSESEDSKRVSVLDLPGDVLIVPQATLGGRLKGKVMQYHGNIDKTLGQELYINFVQSCRDALNSVASQEMSCKVEAGTYGNRQVLSMVTNGPFSHLIEL